MYLSDKYSYCCVRGDAVAAQTQQFQFTLDNASQSERLTSEQGGW